MSNKGYSGKTTSFAKGGKAIGKTSQFLKTEDRFRGKPNPPVVKTEDVFTKSGK